jgi:hypothetical protein
MKVEMPDRLPSIIATIDNCTVPVAQAFLLGQLSRHDKQVPDELFVLRIQIVERRNRLMGHDENVRRGFRIDVPKGDALIILVQNVGVDLSVDDFLENGFLGHEADPQSMNKTERTTALACNRFFASNILKTNYESQDPRSADCPLLRT